MAERDRRGVPPKLGEGSFRPVGSGYEGRGSLRSPRSGVRERAARAGVVITGSQKKDQERYEAFLKIDQEKKDAEVKRRRAEMQHAAGLEMSRLREVHRGQNEALQNQIRLENTRGKNAHQASSDRQAELKLAERNEEVVSREQNRADEELRQRLEMEKQTREGIRERAERAQREKLDAARKKLYAELAQKEAEANERKTREQRIEDEVLKIERERQAKVEKEKQERANKESAAKIENDAKKLELEKIGQVAKINKKQRKGVVLTWIEGRRELKRDREARKILEIQERLLKGQERLGTLGNRSFGGTGGLQPIRREELLGKLELEPAEELQDRLGGKGGLPGGLQPSPGFKGKVGLEGSIASVGGQGDTEDQGGSSRVEVEKVGGLGLDYTSGLHREGADDEREMPLGPPGSRREIPIGSPIEQAPLGGTRRQSLTGEVENIQDHHSRKRKWVSRFKKIIGRKNDDDKGKGKVIESQERVSYPKIEERAEGTSSDDGSYRGLSSGEGGSSIGGGESELGSLGRATSGGGAVSDVEQHHYEESNGGGNDKKIVVDRGDNEGERGLLGSKGGSSRGETLGERGQEDIALSPEEEEKLYGSFLKEKLTTTPDYIKRKELIVGGARLLGELAPGNSPSKPTGTYAFKRLNGLIEFGEMIDTSIPYGAWIDCVEKLEKEVKEVNEKISNDTALNPYEQHISDDISAAIVKNGKIQNGELEGEELTIYEQILLSKYKVDLGSRNDKEAGASGAGSS